MFFAVIIQILFVIFVTFFVVFNCYEIFNSVKNKKQSEFGNSALRGQTAEEYDSCSSGFVTKKIDEFRKNADSESDSFDEPIGVTENFNPMVSVFLPVCNETGMVESLLESVSSLSYSNREIFLLDDSDAHNADVIKSMVERFNSRSAENNGLTSPETAGDRLKIKYCRRTGREGFKSGNLQFGLSLAAGDFIAVFDADCRPPTDFFEKTIYRFRNEKLGFLQTAIDFRNRGKNTVTEFLALEISHKDEMTSGLSTDKNFVSLTGSSCIWRRKCLNELGGFRSDTLTEDVDLCYRAQIKGWEYDYVGNVVSSELLPENISALRVQRHRWACGIIKNAFIHTGRVIADKNLNPAQKFNALMIITPGFLLASFCNTLLFSLPTVFLTEHLGLFFDITCLIFLINTVIWGFNNVNSGKQNSKRKNELRKNAEERCSVQITSGADADKKSGTGSVSGDIFRYVCYVLMFIPMSFYYYCALIQVCLGIRIGFIPTPKGNDAANHVPETENFCGGERDTGTVMNGPSLNSFLHRLENMSLVFSFVLCVLSAVYENYWIFLYGAVCLAGFMLVFGLSLSERKQKYYQDLKHVVITGASGEIGGALARSYAEAGRHLTLSGRNEQKLLAVKEECEKLGACVDLEILDLRDTGEVRKWMQELSRNDPVDLLIVNAGLNTNIGEDLAGEPFDEAKALVEVNLLANIALIDAALPAMRERKKGQIAILSSLAAYYGLIYTPTYCATKAALRNYGNSLRAWLKPDGIKVNVILPGYVDSPMCRAMPGPKPFLMKADRAAGIIRRGLEWNFGRISFPFPLNLGIWSLSLLPHYLAAPIASLFGYGIMKRKK